MTFVCSCGNYKNGQPYKATGTRPWLCPKCVSTGRSESYHAPKQQHFETDKDHVNRIVPRLSLAQRLRRAG